MLSPEQSQEINLWDAAKIGETLILASESEEALKVDPECWKIGGHVHIAVVTSTCFHWY
jgi:hypothetical protein